MKGIILWMVLAAAMLVACGTPLPTAVPTTAVELGQATLTAPNLQASRQAPHRMQRVYSKTCGFFGVPSIAWTGQARAHSMQPLHDSA